MKYYIIAGEASGDLHGSNLVKALKQADPETSVRAWGGDLLEQSGASLVKHYRELAFMGFTEVLLNLRTILRNISFCKEDIVAYQPDCIILIDYPGFNLRIAEWAKAQGYKVVYYISPQVWAWKSSRVKKIKAAVDLMLTILPFEADFYKTYHYPVTFVGHPLLDALQNYSPGIDFREKSKLDERPVIALLPGSRKQEINTLLPIMLEAVKEYRDQYQIVIAGAPAATDSLYEPFLKNYAGVKLVRNRTYDLLSGSHAALVTSGTATLETALFKVPQVVCYKGGQLSYLIAKRLVKIRYISLVNLIMDRLVVKELIQGECNPWLMKAELDKLLPAGERRQQMLDDYEDLIQQLGNAGASNRAAIAILQLLKP